MEPWQRAGFGIYVHWPFCLHKCPYCDFNSHVSRNVDQAQWRDALVAEIGRTAAVVPGRTVDTVFFGGGTPSLMPVDTVEAVIGAIDRVWGLKPGAEITLEANPTSVEAGKFAGYAGAGVNRVSLGIQALRDADLKALGRMHSAVEAMQAFDIAVNCFDRVSFDLIYARQNQTVADWRRELAEALALGPEHLSLYQLTIEAGTRFGDMLERGNLRGLPGDGLAADLYEVTQELCGEAGLPAYEVSNHARTGQESRHNLIYWRGGDFAGIGPGAHGRLTAGGVRRATQTLKDPAGWLDGVRSGHGGPADDLLNGQDQATEYLMMSLRLSEGSDLGVFRRLGGVFADSEAVPELVEGGFVRVRDDRLTTTPNGRLVLNAVLARLLA